MSKDTIHSILGSYYVYFRGIKKPIPPPSPSPSLRERVSTIKRIFSPKQALPDPPKEKEGTECPRKLPKKP